MEELIHSIRGTALQRQEVIKKLVSNNALRNDIQSFVAKNKGTSDEGLMVFHDSIIAFVKRVYSDPMFSLSTSHNGYIFGIAKNIWLSKLKVASRMSVIKDEGSITENLEVPDFTANIFSCEKFQILHKVLEQLKMSCKEVLLLWAGGYSMSEIAEKLGFATEGAARKKKFDCYNGLMTWIEANPSILNELKN